MSSEGPRYVPPHVIAAKRHRNHQAHYVEVRPTVKDISLAEAVIAWNLRNFGANPPTTLLVASVLVANDVAAAKRFLDNSGVARNADGQHVADEDIYFGRSMLVYPSNSQVSLPGWIASVEDSFDVVIRDNSGLFRKITANADNLIEDDIHYRRSDLVDLFTVKDEGFPDGLRRFRDEQFGGGK